MQVGVEVVEILGDRRVGAGIHLALEGEQVVPRGLGLGVVFGVGGDFDVEVAAGLGADELDQVVGVAQLAGEADAGGQVAAQGDDAADAGGLVALQDLADLLAGRADARQVRRGLVAFALDLENRLEGAFLGGAAGAVGHREELGLEGGQLLAHRTQLLGAFGGLRREEFDGDGAWLSH